MMSSRPLPCRQAVTLCLWGAFFALPLAADAQQRLVQGRVVDAATNQPIAGAQVLILGTGLGSLTNQAGNFRIEVPPDVPAQVTIELTRIGYRTASEEVSVGTLDLRISMEQVALELDRIVVTGTVGETLQRSLGHSMTTISAADVTEEVAVPDLASLLDGRAPGVVVLRGTGITGSGPKINIRGSSSLSLSGEPLIYVDGIRVNNETATGPDAQGFGSAVISRLNDINPEDIESIEIIKGPAAATLYGTEAANGLIQIITKAGREGRPTVDVRIRQGAQWLDNIGERMPTNFERDRNGVLQTLNLTKDLIDQGNPPFRTGHLQGYGLTVRGGAGDLGYYAALSHDSDQGVDPTNSARRSSGRANLSLSPHSSLDITANMGLSVGKIRIPRETAVWGGLYFASPAQAAAGIQQDRRPPDIVRGASDDRQEYRRTTVGLTLDHKPTSWFGQRLIVGQDLTDEDNRTVTPFMSPELAKWYSGTTVLGSISRSQRTISLTTLDYSATLSTPLTEGLVSKTSVGTQYYKRQTEMLLGSGREFPARGADILGAAGVTASNDDLVENATLGAYVQEQLSWRNRIFLTGALRVDNNSAFGKDFSWIVYPKVAGTWVLSEEDFWNVGWLEGLRLRAAYGQSGQQPEYFAAIRAYRPISTGDGGSALSPQFIGNPDLAPERGSEFEIGFEAGLLNDRVGIDFTYYDSRTSDGILQREMAPSSGFAGLQFLNLAEIANRGVELGLNTQLLDRRRFGWNVNLNLSWNQNEVLDLGGEQEIDLAGGSASNAFFHRVGFPTGSFFWQDIVNVEVGADGIAKNVLCDGGPEAGHQPVPCDEAPKLFQGSSNPKYEGSLSTELRLFDNLRINAMLDFKADFVGYNFTKFHWCRDYLLCVERHDPTHADADPVIVAMLQNPQLQNGIGIADQTFAKFREVSLTYSVPDSWLGEIQRATVMLSARNLHTWTNWTGIDPEASFVTFESSPIHGRWEWLNTPQPMQLVTTFRFTL